MDARALSPDEARELAALRARAYGPEPDIADDARALQRLRDLESAAHGPGATTSAHHDEDPALTRATGSRSRAPDTPTPESDTMTAVPSEPVVTVSAAPTPSRFIRLMRNGWLVAAVAVVAAAATVWGVLQAVAPRSDLVLGLVSTGGEGSEEFARPSFLDAQDFDLREVQRYEAYGPLDLWLAVAASGDRCLLVDADEYGIVGVSCTPPDLDPIVDVRIWRGMRRDIFGEFAVNTVLRFQYRDGRVHLWVRSPSET
ncbi:hypothetical protein ACTU3I_14470 [Microbacterium sp. RD1]|uniref:hypothetical protein n=1 Tax=Microbacterium sp. RD1 TaxID=3457313 RepID=UPI003FA52ACF